MKIYFPNPSRPGLEKCCMFSEQHPGDGEGRLRISEMLSKSPLGLQPLHPDSSQLELRSPIEGCGQTIWTPKSQHLREE
jgi:hypothetical protein